MKKSTVIMALTCMLSAWTVSAQSPADGPGPGDGGPPGGGFGHGGRHHPPDSLIIKTLDANSDGVIDATELANAATALKTLDKNGDGQLTRDEYMPHRPDGGTNGPPPGVDGQNGKHRPKPPILAALDANGDGVIDATEIANAPKALAALDKNGDGKLTPDEWRPQRPPGDGPPGDGNGPGGPGDGPGPDDGPPPPNQ